VPRAILVTPGDPTLWAKHSHAPAPGTVLGSFDAIPDGQGREFTFGPDHDAFSMFVVRRGSAAFATSTCARTSA
jgi:hypothetical protein